MQDQKPRLVLCCGDPAAAGVVTALKLASIKQIRELFNLIIIFDQSHSSELLIGDLPFELRQIHQTANITDYQSNIDVVQYFSTATVERYTNTELEQINPGVLEPAGATIALNCADAAIKAIRDKEADAVIFIGFHNAALKLAGMTSQTLAQRLGFKLGKNIGEEISLVGSLWVATLFPRLPIVQSFNELQTNDLVYLATELEKKIICSSNIPNPKIAFIRFNSKSSIDHPNSTEEYNIIKSAMNLVHKNTAQYLGPLSLAEALELNQAGEIDGVIVPDNNLSEFLIELIGIENSYIDLTNCDIPCALVEVGFSNGQYTTIPSKDISDNDQLATLETSKTAAFNIYNSLSNSPLYQIKHTKKTGLKSMISLPLSAFKKNVDTLEIAKSNFSPSTHSTSEYNKPDKNLISPSISQDEINYNDAKKGDQTHKLDENQQQTISRKSSIWREDQDIKFGKRKK